MTNNVVSLKTRSIENLFEFLENNKDQIESMLGVVELKDGKTFMVVDCHDHKDVCHKTRMLQALAQGSFYD